MTTQSEFAALRAKIESEHNCYPWSSEPEVGQFLFALCQMIGAKRVLEVGAWKGLTTLWLAQAVGWDGVWTIDKKDNFSQHFPEEGYKNFIKGLSWEVIPKLSGRFDLVFLDTDHQYESTLAELSSLNGMVSDGGFVCLHDSLGCDGVHQAICKSHWPVGQTFDTPRGCGLTLLTTE